MSFMTAETLLKVQNHRYATKQFKKGAIIPTDQWSALEQSLYLTASSYGLQPWKFIVVSSPELKKQLRAHSWNQSQVEDCSHYVVIAARATMDEAWIHHYLDRVAEVRAQPREPLNGYANVIIGDLCGKRKGLAFEVNARQCYIALGNLMTSAALLGLDTCPMEGFIPPEYDQVLGLAGGEWRAVVACAVGYRDPEDKLSKLPKVRFPMEQVIDRR